MTKIFLTLLIKEDMYILAFLKVSHFYIVLISIFIITFFFISIHNSDRLFCIKKTILVRFIFTLQQS